MSLDPDSTKNQDFSTRFMAIRFCFTWCLILVTEIAFRNLCLFNALFVSSNSFSWKPLSLVSHVLETIEKLVKGKVIPVNEKMNALWLKNIFFFIIRKTLSFAYKKTRVVSFSCNQSQDHIHQINLHLPKHMLYFIFLFY